jgi:hypothetical protein
MSSSILDFFNQQKIQQDKFNYDQEARKLQQRAKVAANLQDFRWGGEQKAAPGGLLAGGMTSPLATLATIATNIAGAKLLASTQKEREDLDKISNETFRDGMNMLKNEGASEKDAREQAAELVDPEKARTSFLLKATGRADGNMGPDNYNPARDVSAAYEPVAIPVLKSAGGGRGGQGGPTAQELQNHASRFGGGRGVQGGPTEQQLPADDMTVYPTNTPFKYDFGLGSRATGPKTAVMGRDDLGVNRMTPQQMEDPAAREYKSDVADRNAPLWNITSMDAPNVMGRDDMGVNRQTPQQMEQHVGRMRVGTEVGRRSNSDIYAQSPLAVPNATPSFQSQVPTQTSTPADPWAYGPDESQVPQAGPVYNAAADDKYLKQSYEKYVNDRAEQAKVLAKTASAARDSRIDEARSVLRRSGSKGQTVDNMFDEQTVGQFFNDDRKNYIAVGDKIFNTRTKEFMGGSAPKERNVQSFKPGDMIPDGRGGWVEVPNGPSSGKDGKEYAASWDTAQGRVIAYKDGSTQLVGGNTPVAAKAAEADAAKVSATEKMNRAANLIVGSIGQVIANGDHEAATGVQGKVGSAWNAGTGANTSAAAARSRIDNISNKMIPLIHAQLTEDHVSANKVADTIKELNALIASRANLDYNRLSGEELKAELLKLQNSMIDTIQRKAYGVDAVNTNQTVAPSGWTPTRK